jgi:diguanylate cyclase (GGDEF)-like protein
MATRVEKAFRIGSVLAVTLFIGTFTMVYRSTKRLVAINHLVEHSQEVLVKLEALQSALDEAVSSTRNYVLSGNETNLTRFAAAKVNLAELSSVIRSLTVDNPVQQTLVQKLEPQLVSSYQYWGLAQDKRRLGDTASADQLMSSTNSLQLMRANRETIVAMIKEENQVLGERSRDAEASARRAILIELFLAIGASAVLISAFLFVQMDMNEKARALQEKATSEQNLREAHDQLNAALRESEARARENTELSNLGDLFQSCQTVEEACKIIASALPRLLDSRPGAICFTSPSRNIVETIAMWNEATAEHAFAPGDCWALRRGKVHVFNDESSALRCAHVSKSSPRGYICVPLAAQGETLGVLYIEDTGQALKSGSNSRTEWDNLQRIATAAGERISLALGNLNLREILRNQSIRDPLTGLFNRRYMEESLARELHRAARKDRKVALIMIDVDHFKDFNDTFGHQAGDMLMQELAGTLKSRVRASDIACRYGGEEFVLILSEADADGASSCMEQVRAEIKQYHLHHHGQALGSVTVSAGVAVFPDHADDADALVRAADLALYRAKSEGRDKVLVGCALSA